MSLNPFDIPAKQIVDHRLSRRTVPAGDGEEDPRKPTRFDAIAKGLETRFFRRAAGQRGVGLSGLALTATTTRTAAQTATPGSESCPSTSEAAVIPMWRTAFPDFTVYPGLILAQRGLVAVRLKTEGTHNCTFMGKAPTG